MPQDITNIRAGKAIVYLAPVGTSAPTVTGTLGETLTVNSPWSTPGYFADDSEFTVTEELNEVKPYGELAVLKYFKKAVGAKGKFTLYESDADAFKIAMSDGTAGTTVSDNADTSEVTYKTMLFVFDHCVIHFKKVKIKANFTMKLDDGQGIKIPLEWVAVKSTTEQANKGIWEYLERTPDA